MDSNTGDFVKKRFVSVGCWCQRVTIVERFASRGVIVRAFTIGVLVSACYRRRVGVGVLFARLFGTIGAVAVVVVCVHSFCFLRKQQTGIS